MPSLKDTRKKNVKDLADLLKKLGESSDKTAQKMDTIGSKLSDFVDLLAEAKEEELKYKKRLEKERAARAEERKAIEEERKAREEERKSEKKSAAEKKASDAVSDKIKKDKKDLEDALEVLEEKERRAKREKIEELNKAAKGKREKQEKYAEAGAAFESGDFFGGLFAAMFAGKKQKKKEKKLPEEQEAERLQKELDLEAKQKEKAAFQKKEKGARETIERISGTAKPAAAPTPVKSNVTEEQILTEETKLKEEDKLKIQEKQEKDLGDIDNTITKVFGAPLEVKVVNFSDLTGNFEKLGNVIKDSDKANNGFSFLGDILEEAGFLEELATVSEILSGIGAFLGIAAGGVAITAAFWTGLAMVMDADARKAAERAKKEEADRLKAAQQKTAREDAQNRSFVTGQVTTAQTMGFTQNQLLDYIQSEGNKADKAGNKALAAAWFEKGRELQAQKDSGGEQPPTSEVTGEVTTPAAPEAVTTPAAPEAVTTPAAPTKSPMTPAKVAKAVVTAPVKAVEKVANTTSNAINQLIGGAETGNNYDLAYGDRNSKNGIINTLKIPTLTAEQYSGKKLTEMTLGEVLDFQNYRESTNKGSSAVGKYQFIPGTLKDQIRANNLPLDTIFDAKTQDLLNDSFQEQNKKVLTKKLAPLGKEVTPGLQYMAHYIGAGGAGAVIKAIQQGEGDVTVEQALVNAGFKSPVIKKGDQIINKELGEIKASDFENILSSRLYSKLTPEPTTPQTGVNVSAALTPQPTTPQTGVNVPAAIAGERAKEIPSQPVVISQTNNNISGGGRGSNQPYQDARDRIPSTTSPLDNYNRPKNAG